METRELRREDKAGLSRLIAETYRELPEAMNFKGRPTPSEIGEVIEWKLASIGRGEMVDRVAVDGGRVVADCEILITGARGIIGIIVDREHRRNGIGKRLSEECTRLAAERGVKAIDAEVMESNKPAVLFFRKMGFKEQAQEMATEKGKAILLSKLL
ncbi:Acetyltransferase (GNAT) family protein [uncultured archaeon]|nr:Acetyltransferase (GNAT) family protein [uncultured archaeon]